MYEETDDPIVFSQWGTGRGTEWTGCPRCACTIRWTPTPQNILKVSFRHTSVSESVMWIQTGEHFSMDVLWGSVPHQKNSKVWISQNLNVFSPPHQARWPCTKRFNPQIQFPHLWRWEIGPMSVHADLWDFSRQGTSSKKSLNGCGSGLRSFDDLWSSGYWGSPIFLSCFWLKHPCRWLKHQKQPWGSCFYRKIGSAV